jgi:hypothetical protein
MEIFDMGSRFFVIEDGNLKNSSNTLQIDKLNKKKLLKVKTKNPTLK